MGIGNNKTVDFYITKGIVEELMDYLGYSGRYSFMPCNNLPNEFHPGQTAQINLNGETIGIIGKVHPEKTNDAVFMFEINLNKILEKKTGKSISPEKEEGCLHREAASGNDTERGRTAEFSLTSSKGCKGRKNGGLCQECSGTHRAYGSKGKTQGAAQNAPGFPSDRPAGKRSGDPG